jgi:hypothetical protein
MFWYMKELYPSYYPGKRHPFISLEQRVRIRDELEEFANEWTINIDDLKDMAADFFEKVGKSDHNINHFATRGILLYRYASVFGTYPQV